jgi:hypothetical protein
LRCSLLVACFGSLTGLAQGQDVTGVFETVAGVLQQREREPRWPQQNPLEPTGHPGLLPREPGMPQPLPPPGELRLFRLLSPASDLRQDEGRVTITRAHFTYRGYDVIAEQAFGNLETEVFRLEGAVKITGIDAVVEGEVIEVDFQAGTFRAEQHLTQLRPQFLQGRLLDDLYVRGAVVFGTEDEIRSQRASVTTCNLDHPHYEIFASESTVRPGRRLVMRDVRVRVLGRTILSLPHLAIPLEQRDERYIPEVGQSPDEGYYAKWRYPVTGGDRNMFDALLDVMTRLGGGLGGEYTYNQPTLSGMARLYGVIGGIGTIEAINRHVQRIGNTTLNVDTHFNRNNYLVASESTLFNTRAQWLIPQGLSNSRLSFFMNENRGPTFRSEQRVSGFTDQRVWSPLTRHNLELNWVQSSSVFQGGQPVTREQVDVRFRGSHDLRRALAEVEYIRSIPVGEQLNFFNTADRTPVLALRSDARRLFGPRAATTLPFQTELSLGEFFEPRDQRRITRGFFDFSFQRPDRGRGPSNLNINGRFRQGVYDDNTAQYVLQFGSNYSYRFGPDTSFNLRYNYLRPHGFTPLLIDRTGRTNFASADISYRPIRSLIVGAQTGYDFLLEERGQIAWQPVGIRAEFRPTDNFMLRNLSTYDTFRQAWSNVRMDMAWLLGETFISAGVRYDGIRHTFGNVNFYIDGLQLGKLRTSALANYNGYLKRFEATHLSFTYDLHCAEAIFQVIDHAAGFRSGREYVFFIRLKALPFTTPFGTGRRGQPLGPGTGRDFF